MQRTFPRSFASLEDIFGFAEAFFAEQKIAQSIRYPVLCAVEELFTNLVKYNPDAPRDILLSMRNNGGRVEVSLTDFDIDEFDVTAERAVDTTAPLGERKVGGLGLHLVRNMVDSLEYDYSDRQSTITFTKEAEEDDV